MIKKLDFLPKSFFLIDSEIKAGVETESRWFKKNKSMIIPSESKYIGTIKTHHKETHHSSKGKHS